MSSFGSAGGALKAAAAIQALVTNSGDNPAFQVRIGMHSGDVVQSDGDFFGSVVNKAARIAAIAEPGSILVSDIVRGMAGDIDELTFTHMPPAELQGIQGKHQAFKLEFGDAAPC